MGVFAYFFRAPLSARFSVLACSSKSLMHAFCFSGPAAFFLLCNCFLRSCLILLSVWFVERFLFVSLRSLFICLFVWLQVALTSRNFVLRNLYIKIKFEYEAQVLMGQEAISGGKHSGVVNTINKLLEIYVNDVSKNGFISRVRWIGNDMIKANWWNLIKRSCLIIGLAYAPTSRGLLSANTQYFD